jgi:hypothetical protein
MTVLAEPYCVLLFDENFSTPVDKWEDGFIKVYEELKKKNIPVYIVTTATEEAKVKLAYTPFNKIPVFKCDYTVIRTAARTKPALYLLKEGTIVGKWSYKRIIDALNGLNNISALPRKEDIATPGLDSAHNNADSANKK